MCLSLFYPPLLSLRPSFSLPFLSFSLFPFFLSLPFSSSSFFFLFSSFRVIWPPSFSLSFYPSFLFLSFFSLSLFEFTFPFVSRFSSFFIYLTLFLSLFLSLPFLSSSFFSSFCVICPPSLCLSLSFFIFSLFRFSFPSFFSLSLFK